jgi:hypothetical protein
LTSTPEPPRACAGPDIAGLEVELRVPGAGGDVVHGQGRVAPDADLGLVRKQDRKIADLVGAQGVAADHTLLDLGRAPEILAHEAHFLAALGCHDGPCGRVLTRHGRLSPSIGKGEGQGACGGHKTKSACVHEDRLDRGNLL